jgi:hypothetical protein
MGSGATSDSYNGVYNEKRLRSSVPAPPAVTHPFKEDGKYLRNLCLLSLCELFKTFKARRKESLIIVMPLASGLKR